VPGGHSLRFKHHLGHLLIVLNDIPVFQKLLPGQDAQFCRLANKVKAAGLWMISGHDTFKIDGVHGAVIASVAECRALCKKYRDLREQESGRGSGLASKNLGGAGGLRQELWKHLGEFRPLTTEEMAAALGSMVPEGYALAEASADNVNAVQEQRSRDADEEEQERALAAQFMAEMAEDDAELQLGPPLAAEGVAEVGEVGAVAMEGAAAVGGEVEQDDDADGVDGFDRPSREAMGRL